MVAHGPNRFTSCKSCLAWGLSLRWAGRDRAGRGGLAPCRSLHLLKNCYPLDGKLGIGDLTPLQCRYDFGRQTLVGTAEGSTVSFKFVTFSFELNKWKSVIPNKFPIAGMASVLENPSGAPWNKLICLNEHIWHRCWPLISPQSMAWGHLMCKFAL